MNRRVAPAVRCGPVWDRVRQDDDESLSAGRLSNFRSHACAKVRTDRAGFSGEIRCHPSMQAVSLSRQPGACSLGQDARLKVSALPSSRSDVLWGMPERNEFLITMLSEKRTEARRQLGRHAPTGGV